MAENLTGFAYLIAAVLFILALRGLSNPESARMGNVFGMVGMAIAVITTLLSPGVVSYWMIILGILIGGSVGTLVALRIKMTQLPELVAAFHSLVGLAAVFVATAAFYHPGGLQHRLQRQHPRRQPDRDGARHRHRRDHLLRFGHRLPQAGGQDERQPDHVPDAASAQRGHRHRHRPAASSGSARPSRPPPTG